jgi:hypothetical protein
MSVVTVEHAVVRLSAAVEELWSAVGEMALIVIADQPTDQPDFNGPPEGLAAADELLETVSEIQGAIAAARDQLVAGPEAVGPMELARVATQLQGAHHRYWRDVRAHQPVALLRASTRRRGGKWPSWRISVEQSAARCAEPFESVAAALDLGWQEISSLAASAPYPRTSPADAHPSRRIQ